MTWVLIIAIYAHGMTSVGGFRSEDDCKVAAATAVAQAKAPRTVTVICLPKPRDN
jgi:hypothetical protein